MTNKLLTGIISALFGVLVMIIAFVTSMILGEISQNHQEIMLLRQGQSDIHTIVLNMPDDDDIEDLEEDLKEHKKDGHR